MLWAVVIAGAFSWLYLSRFAWNVRTRSFQRLFERAVGDVVDALEAAHACWWVTEGTLIWVTRYGRNGPADIDDVVDDDVDVMVEVADEAEWNRLSAALIEALRARGWRGVNRRSTSARPGMRVDKLQLFLHGWPFQATNVDIHSYLRDAQRREGRSTGDPEGYPFQRWNGALPLDLVHPLARGACYGRSVPCPRAPLEVLGNWDGGEYDGAPLALPLRPVSDAEARILRTHAARLHAADFVSFSSYWSERARG